MRDEAMIAGSARVFGLAASSRARNDYKPELKLSKEFAGET